MRMPPLPADSIHARACKLKCEKILTRPNQEIKTVAGVAGFFSAPVLSIGKTIEAAYIANIIVIHSRLAQRAETVDHTISILISTLQKPEAASEFPVDFAPIHC